MANLLNQKVTCKECHVKAKLRRFPACDKNCRTWQWVQNERAVAANGEVFHQVETKVKHHKNRQHNQQSTIRISEHTLSFEALREQLKNKKVGIFSASTDGNSTDSPAQ